MRMAWSRDSYFADYPAGHLGEPTGTCGATDVLFRASKRRLHYLTLTDPVTGTGLALIATDSPLIGRAHPAAKGNADNRATLFASSEEAGVRGLSGSWVADHEIHARPGASLSGSFLLRAVGP